MSEKQLPINIEKLINHPDYTVSYICCNCGKSFKENETSAANHIKNCSGVFLKETNADNMKQKCSITNTFIIPKHTPQISTTSGIEPTENDKDPVKLESYIINEVAEQNNSFEQQTMDNMYDLNDSCTIMKTQDYIGTENNTDLLPITIYNTSSGHDTLIIENMDPETNETNVKVLTVLNPVSVAEQSLEDDRLMQDDGQRTERDDNVNFDGMTVIEFEEGNGSEGIENEQNNGNLKRKEAHLAHSPKKRRKKNNHTPKKIPKLLIDKVCYQIIEEDKEPEEPPPPNKFSVFEFIDEEEEELQRQILEKEQQEKDRRLRTCKFCKKLFDDPIDVLRHKREVHKFSKVILSKEELKQYENWPDKTHCPICQKPLSKNGHRSLYEKHLIVHSDDFQFECEVCGQQFRRKDHYMNHVVRHVVGHSRK